MKTKLLAVIQLYFVSQIVNIQTQPTVVFRHSLRPNAHTIMENGFSDCMALGTTSDTVIDFY
jgi:hypothetical protein